MTKDRLNHIFRFVGLIGWVGVLFTGCVLENSALILVGFAPLLLGVLYAFWVATAGNDY